ncbi:tRNA glutamyl-Q(34) synthetase GluQRS [Venatoribacter cucullus]|uniref:tRNA glutamyl-Q(34) synthetase GluQRS n=1 Tax=Venatoribacter cucullus TaxID=2661630 RepID=UPI002240CF7F|nr:tRNA glutamyl-Q(34) synthetase GluQRS [Venatoribacter cucullus]UZK02746.1 tRNA glutamyl-Q(34) synthetase GluQRS [Venatoribacter cucullus]
MSAPSPYIGRFAPSPTGPLHFGSLLAALASYLDARAVQGRWLVRIEDLDPPREDPTAAAQILQILDAYGLHWDGEVRYQSLRNEAYQQFLDELIQAGLAFPCQCSRKQLAGLPHRGNCHCSASTDIAWRFLCPDGRYCFDDRLQGRWCEDYTADIGDFVLKRRDGPWSYQLAVVCDDIDQGVTQIVRGIDLIDSTARQALLYQAVGAALSGYAHIPVALENNGQKLSKQNLARALNTEDIAGTLFTALQWLRQQPPAELRGSHTELLRWAVQHWQPQALHGLQALPAPVGFQR